MCVERPGSGPTNADSALTQGAIEPQTQQRTILGESMPRVALRVSMTICASRTMLKRAWVCLQLVPEFGEQDQGGILHAVDSRASMQEHK